jgi:hypothetical protein
MMATQTKQVEKELPLEKELPYCPLSFSILGDKVCRGEKCAWWNYHVGLCAVAVLAIEIGQRVWRNERGIR